MSKHDDTSKRNMGIYWKDASRLRECTCELPIRNRMARIMRNIFTHFEVRDSINRDYSFARAEVTLNQRGSW